MKWILSSEVNINNIQATAILLPQKAKILAYFKNHTSNAAHASSTIIDLVTNQDTRLPKVAYNDGKYSWSSTLVYHFEKYNLKLDDDFIQHVLNNT